MIDETADIPAEASHLSGRIATGYSGTYRLLEFIGGGGTSDVYKAVIETTRNENPLNPVSTANVGPVVACKVLLSRLLDHKKHYRRFQQEAIVAQRLVHPNIVSVYDAGKIDGCPFIISEYVDGGTLSDICVANGKLSIRASLPIFMQITEAFAYAHLSHTVHRDLKPSNIMLAKRNDGSHCAKVGDFGIAKMVNETTAGEIQLTKTGDIFGTPTYMSPEQCRGDNANIDSRSDIYSMGILMYEVLTGRLPLKGTDSLSTLVKQTYETPKALGEIDPDVIAVKKMEKVIFKCLEKEPTSRYQRMEELKRDLELVQLHLDQIKCRETNTVLPIVEKAWSFLPQLARSMSEKVCSIGLRSTGITMGSVILLGVLILASMNLAGWFFVFALPSYEISVLDTPSMRTGAAKFIPANITPANIFIKTDQAQNFGIKGTICNLSGTWAGISSGKDPASKVVLELQQSGNTICGAWTAQGKSGRCKRYFRGGYKSCEDAYICKDIGFDYTSPTPGWKYFLIDKYEFHLVNGGTKLIGTYMSADADDKAWFSFQRSNLSADPYI